MTPWFAFAQNDGIAEEKNVKFNVVHLLCSSLFKNLLVNQLLHN
jgi:hypothetical protein